MTKGVGLWAAVGVTTTDFALVAAGGAMVVVVVVESLPKNFLKPPNQLDFLVVVSTASRGSGVICTSFL